jgi:hypothetical protein
LNEAVPRLLEGRDCAIGACVEIASGALFFSEESPLFSIFLELFSQKRLLLKNLFA